MLKVVGASWWQTRVSSYILGFTGVFAVFVLVLGEFGSRVEDDGIYSATVFWTSRARLEFWGQSNVLDEVPMGAARAYFNPDKSSTGWSMLEIETHSHYPDYKQAYAAGLLEGSLTWQWIHWHWQNTVENACEGHEETCQLIRDYLQQNSDWVREVAKERSENDAFWHQINLFYYQLEGLETGFNYGVKRSQNSAEIPSVDFLWMNYDSDLLELMQKFNGSASLERPSASSSLVKLIWQRPDEPKVVVSQNTHGMYGKMLRIMKRYKFNYHMTAARFKSIPGKDIVFTGYPGCLSSQDDFYTVSSNDKQHNLIVTGNTLNNYDPNLWNGIESEDQVFSGPRIMAANRLAADGRMWYRYLYRGNSGTGNKQWQVVNLARLKKLKLFEQQHVLGVLWIVEQMPGIVHGTDQTFAFLKNTYWANFGLPHHREIKEISNVRAMKEKYGSLFSTEQSPMAAIFRECKVNCSSINEIENLMRIKIPFSGIQKESRGDLLQLPEPSGLIDNKVILGNSEGIIDFKAYSGPPYNKHPSVLENFIDSYTYFTENDSLNNDTSIAKSFRWSHSPFKNFNHFGQEDDFSFDDVQPKWVWN